ncbi:uncharacterized protein PgNI_02680 [Pyricularia grisea]|uniref:Peptidase A1 domain-containing protein n=1 Tax=Pyricularia grisea TaxID=148305 RepID=A0A6P8BEX6_PYRGI|nr:uncharacterized protein PgNI_02680 [Pyricularia grisea]TLD14340.1 hypothetical protein PgNI_02680 [Pyricularia grisea]
MPVFMQTFALLATWSAAVISASSVRVSKYDPPTWNGPLSIYKTHAKYGVPISPELSAAVRRAGFDTEKLNKRQQRQQQGSATAYPYYGDTEWLMQVKVGTPPQFFNAQVDTGSSEFWVFSDQHPTAREAGHIVYSPSRSLTAAFIPGLSWNQTYASGNSAWGNQVYNNVVQLGDVVAQSQAVLPATAASEGFVNSAFESLLGLDLLEYTATLPIEARGPPNFFGTIKSSLPSPLFSMDLKYKKQSLFDFSVVPSNRYRGRVSWAPIHPVRAKGINYSRWNITAFGYGIGDAKTVPLKPRTITGVVDTGTTLLYLNKPIVEKYYSKVPGSRYNPLKAAWFYPCKISHLLPDFSFGVGPVGKAVTITIPGKYFNWSPNEVENNECFGGLQESIDFKGGKASIFGTVAIKAVYVIFEDPRPAANPRIGWAAKDV